MNKINIITVVSGLLCFALLLSVYLGWIGKDISQERERCSFIAQNEAQRIVTIVDSIMVRTSTLKALVQDNNGDTGFFDDIADDIYDSVLSETGIRLRNLSIAPGGIVEKVYPDQDNESFNGFDYFDETRPGNAEAREAYNAGSTILTNPFSLIQGGVGISGRSPVFIYTEKDNSFWGIVSVTIDFDNFVNVLRLDELGDNGFIYELSYIDRDDSIHIMKNNGVPAADAVSLRFPVRNLLWEISISPVNGWYSMGKVVFVSIVILAVAIFASLFTNVVCRLRKANIVLSRLSNTDKLTGCENRRAFEEMIARYETVGYSPDFVYVSADVNGLKTVNDNLGHNAGDEIICGAAECLKDVLSAFGHVYRTGGDEFVALIFAKEEAVLLLKDEIINRVEKWRGDYVHTMSISMGFASKREFPDSSISELAVISDRRMYEDKKTYYSKSGISVHNGSYVYERMP